MIEIDEEATLSAAAKKVPNGPFITVDELAAYLRIPRSTAYLLVQRGEVPHFRAGRHIRIPRSALDNFGRP